jgi:hypothetical protein
MALLGKKTKPKPTNGGTYWNAADFSRAKTMIIIYRVDHKVGHFFVFLKGVKN